MVPDTHPVLNELKYTEKVKSDYDGREIEYTRYNLKEQLYLIEGVDNNLPLEATPYNGYKDNDPYVKANSFSKFVGLNDKIKITPVDSQGNPEENKPTNNLPNSQPGKLNNEILLQYFQENNIQSIKLEGDKLIIERNDNSISNNFLTNFSDLKGIDKYLENKNNKTVSRKELESGNTSHTDATKNPENNNLLIG
jgi:hypothetical protein